MIQVCLQLYHISSANIRLKSTTQSIIPQRWQKESAFLTFDDQILHFAKFGNAFHICARVLSAVFIVRIQLGTKLNTSSQRTCEPLAIFLTPRAGEPGLGS